MGQSANVGYALDPARSKDEVLCTVNGVPLTRKDLMTLSPGSWLNDEVINALLHILSTRPGAPKILALNTYFFELLAPSLEYKRDVGQRMMARLPNLFDYDMVLVPIHRPESDNYLDPKNHWAMVLVDMQLHRIVYYDSLPNDGKLIVGVLEALLTDEAVRRHHAVIRWAMETDWATRGWLPKQENSFDCGVFALMFALSSYKPVSFSQRNTPELRVRMADTLLRWRE